MAAFQKIIIAVSLFFFAFLGYVVPLTERGRAATCEVVDEYYRRYNSGEFDYIRGSMLTAGASEYSSGETIRTAYEKLGKYQGGTRRSFKLLDLKGNRFYYRFDASYEKGPATDSFVLVKDQTGFKIENLPNSYFPCLGKK
ncbi:MAG: hypothetical protein PHV36_14010 [Elusimicrobiales bacterium]|nr:hypothetical protein [Elusimicrobiales bacterium]